MPIRPDEIQPGALVTDVRGIALGRVTGIDGAAFCIRSPAGRQFWLVLADVFTLDSAGISMIFGMESLHRYARPDDEAAK